MGRETVWQKSRRGGTRRRFLQASSATAGGAAALALVGCGDDDDDHDGGDGTATATESEVESPDGTSSPEPATGTATERPAGTEGQVAGGTIRTGTFLAVLGIDPHIEVSVGLLTCAAVYTPLGAFNSQDQTFNLLFAESLEQISDTEFIFSLRQGVNFHDIPPVNAREQIAQDVVYSFERFRDLPQAQNNAFLKTIVNSMEAVDSHTFRLTTKTPYAETLLNLGGAQASIVPQEAVEAFGDLSTNAIGAGPYQLAEYKKAVSSHLVRNPNYWDQPKPYPDEATSVVILDTGTLIQAYRSDEIDINGALLTKLDYEELLGDEDLVNSTLPALHYGSFGLNASVAPWNDVRVRKALYMGIDRQQFIDKIGQGDGTPMGALNVGLDFWAMPQDELAPYIGPDVDGAKALLSEAGYPDGFDITILTTAGVQLFIDHAEILVSELAKLGINAELSLSDLTTYLTSILFAGNFDATVFTHNPYETPYIPLGFYHRTGLSGVNWFHYDNAELSALLDTANVTLDVEERKAHVLEAQKMVLEDAAPMLNFYSPTAYSSHHKRLKGYDPTLRSFQAFQYTEWLDPNA
jgi:peptide/nickel transport system substrate-binding protein